jgi:hypothetical protein
VAATYTSPEDWQRVAVFDIDADATIAHTVGANARDASHLILPSRESPRGVSRHELFVDFSIGEELAMRVAHAQLQAMQQWAAAGMIPGFRLVSRRAGSVAASRQGRHLVSVSSARDLR